MQTTEIPSTTPLSHRQLLAISLLVPAVLLMLLELACRLGNLEQLIAGPRVMQLEMPAWMALDDNTKDRDIGVPTTAAQIDWLSLFESGEGYRVRLKPNINERITNTFSRIKTDPDYRYNLQSNSLGFRSAEVDPVKSEDTFRILIFGDSSSFGWGVNQQDSYGAVLASELQRLMPERRIEIGNFAMPGDSSEYGAMIYHTIIPQFDFDAIILGFGANDAKLTLTRHHDQVKKFSERALLQRLRYYACFSSLFRTLEALTTNRTPTAAGAKQSKRIPAVGQKRYAVNLRKMGIDAAQRGAQSVVVLNLCTPGAYAKMASRVAFDQGFLYLNGQSLLLDLIPEIKARKIHPDLVDRMMRFYPDFLKTDERSYVTSDGCHPNALGHRIVGIKLAEIISNNFRFPKALLATNRSPQPKKKRVIQ